MANEAPVHTQPEWLYGGNGAANDAALLPLEDWWDLWGDGSAPASKEDLERWWAWHDDQADWQMCQRMGVGL